MHSKDNSRGFTLIEVMIAVVIVAILAAIAIPNYQKHVVRGNRAAAQAAMMDIANLQQQYFLANRSYTDSLNTLNYTTPSEVGSKYTINIDLDKYLDSSCAEATGSGTPPTFVIRLTPSTSGSQASDGTIYLSNSGSKCPTGKW